MTSELVRAAYLGGELVEEAALAGGVSDHA
jgi:hypothetical protein